MTSAPITDVPVSGYVQVKASQPQTVQTNAFSDVMSQAGRAKAEPSHTAAAERAAERQNYSSVNEEAETDRAQETQQSGEPKESDSVTETREAKTDETAAEELQESGGADEVSEKLKETREELLAQIAELLQVSVQQVEAAMSQLGLEVSDLMQQGNMAGLTAQLTGSEVVDVLTQEELFANVDALTEAAQETFAQLADELGMDVQELMHRLDEAMQETEQGDFEQNLQMSQSTEMTENWQITDAAAETLQDKSQSKQDGQENLQQGEMMAGNTVQMSESTALGAEAVSRFADSFSAQQTREIIDQIADYVRINNHAQVSEMEIQLNPANLGTVNLQVASKNGAITAQLTVQDEAVKAALESQLMQLRDSLQEQGLKIEAVEVTIASHEFEQNLEQDAQNEQQKEAQTKKSARRILNLDELAEDEELVTENLSDADRLQVEMMRMGGNKLNFQV